MNKTSKGQGFFILLIICVLLGLGLTLTSQSNTETYSYQDYLEEFREDHPAAYGRNYNTESYAYEYLEYLAERVGNITARNLNVSRVVADQMVVWKTKRGI